MKHSAAAILIMFHIFWLPSYAGKKIKCGEKLTADGETHEPASVYVPPETGVIVRAAEYLGVLLIPEVSEEDVADAHTAVAHFKQWERRGDQFVDSPLPLLEVSHRGVGIGHIFFAHLGNQENSQVLGCPDDDPRLGGHVNTGGFVGLAIGCQLLSTFDFFTCIGGQPKYMKHYEDCRRRVFHGLRWIIHGDEGSCK